MTETSIEELIEKLAMAVTHSQQGEYIKNENFVREIIKEITTKIEENVLREVIHNLQTKFRFTRDMPSTEHNRDMEEAIKSIKSIAESKGIKL